MPPGGPGGPHGGGGGPHGGGGRGPLSGGFGGYGRGPLSGGPGGRSYGSMMRPPGGYWGENSGPLSPDRPHSSGYNPDIPLENESDELLSTKLSRNIYRAQVEAHRKSMKLDRGTPVPGKDIRIGSRVKGFFVGIGRTITSPFASLRDDYSADVASLEYGDKQISKKEFGRRMYKIEERKLYKQLKRGLITVDEYNAGCDRLEQQHIGSEEHSVGGPTR